MMVSTQRKVKRIPMNIVAGLTKKPYHCQTKAINKKIIEPAKSGNIKRLSKYLENIGLSIR
jgi:hypothetical protein